MNGFADRGLQEGDFEGKSGLKAFDAFPKTKASYLQHTSSGANWTLLLIVTCVWLSVTESMRWWVGTTHHNFSVEKGISHDLQINLDIVVAMQCKDLNVNVQDASGDRILAGDTLKMDPTRWNWWVEKSKNIHRLEKDQGKNRYHEEDVHDYLGAAKAKRKFPKTPKLRGAPDSCRIYGTLEGNKVQGDFHITARGHGYMAFGDHLPHDQFNFSHQVNELSFGPYYPSLHNPLDNTRAVTPTSDDHFYKFQYYISVVPTLYTDTRSTIFTNQYAVTEQSHAVPEMAVPGVFVKFDIEPILLTISEENGGLLALIVRLVNVVSGVMVAGGWCFRVGEAVVSAWGRRSRRSDGLGVLHGRSPSMQEKKI
ncbi:endoplasmic reticulum vesicle transporter-domain-containing protein [Phyllosticta citriasiana]|uniref:Endoplasmic reticulum-Golgi intermediate compartment protein n=1 Tax=Phyllosticta citriasiana TaxID=595635 RepID=A0ABR1KBZ8_9PEZI